MKLHVIRALAILLGIGALCALSSLISVNWYINRHISVNLNIPIAKETPGSEVRILRVLPESVMITVEGRYADISGVSPRSFTAILRSFPTSYKDATDNPVVFTAEVVIISNVYADHVEYETRNVQVTAIKNDP